MTTWFISIKIVHHNGGIYEEYEIFDVDSAKSGREVLDEYLAAKAAEHFTQEDRILVISFNKV